MTGNRNAFEKTVKEYYTPEAIAERELEQLRKREKSLRINRFNMPLAGDEAKGLTKLSKTRERKERASKFIVARTRTSMFVKQTKEEKAAKKAQRKKENRARFERAGLCNQCGNCPPDYGFVTCGNCRNK